MTAIYNIDMSILEFIRDTLGGLFLDNLMPIITTLASGGMIWIVIGVMLLITKKYRKYGIILFIAMILCSIIGSFILKPLFERPRPFDLNYIKLLIAPPTDYSFPSGHTMISFAAAMVIFYANKKMGIGALLLAFLIGVSRLYLFVHYPSDVIVGAVLGILIGILSVKTFLKIIDKKKINI
ncbi:MAG: phosphatase PAP2 family protein [Bacilli bacterium]|nr:phosphatase PAP2 family protein [Bacilli bacterium]